MRFWSAPWVRSIPIAAKLPCWALGNVSDSQLVVGARLNCNDGHERDHHPLLECDGSVLPWTRLRFKTPLRVLGDREASPPPIRRKWLILPEPLSGDQGHAAWTAGTVSFILTFDPSISTLYSTLHFAPQHLIFMTRAPQTF